jgi:hypothetical protein
MPVVKTPYLNLTVDDKGVVWHCTSGPIVSSRQTWDTFVCAGLLADIGTCRLVGCLRNAPLIVALYDLVAQKQLGAVELCGPSAPAGSLTNDSPELILHRLHSVVNSAYCGGWHRATRCDRATYALMASTEPATLVIEHPLWWPLSWLRGLDADALAMTIISIIDPRFWVSRDDPDDDRSLRVHFGLDVTNRKPVTAGECDERFRILCRCFSGPEASGYLFEIYKHNVTTAAALFLELLKQCWLDEVSLSHRGRILAPEILFPPVEAAAFRRHLGR